MWLFIASRTLTLHCGRSVPDYTRKLSQFAYRPSNGEPETHSRPVRATSLVRFGCGQSEMPLFPSPRWCGQDTRPNHLIRRIKGGGMGRKLSGSVTGSLYNILLGRPSEIRIRTKKRNLITWLLAQFPQMRLLPWSMSQYGH